MGRRVWMQRFARWHIWLGWIAGVPVLLWLASGLFMAARPIDEVRGTALRRDPAPIDAAGLTAPATTGRIAGLILIDEAGRAMWIVTPTNGEPRRFDAHSGAAVGAPDAGEARRLAIAAWAGQAPLTGLRRYSAAATPLDLRRPRPSWQARFADGSHLYLDAETGEVLAVRTRYWRIYDVMWGIHIMDLQTREDTSNAFLWLVGGLALGTGVLGSVLLFRRRKARR